MLILLNKHFYLAIARNLWHAGWGFLIWALASVGCGLSQGFWTLLIWRVIMGAGEASIINLTGPFIDDVAPPTQKTLWFGVLFLVRLIYQCPMRSLSAGRPLPCHVQQSVSDEAEA